MGGMVWYDWERSRGEPTSGNPPRWRKWLQQVLGADYCGRVTRVVLTRRGASHGAFVHVAQLAGLEELDVAWGERFDEHVTDADVAELRGLTKLRFLSLRGGDVTNRGVSYLKGLAGLRELDLTGTLLDDDGISQLRGLGNLRSLDLTYTRVSDRGVQELKRAMPSLTIKRRSSRTLNLPN